MKNKKFIVTLISIFILCVSSIAQKEIFVDDRDGQEYKIVEIGTHVWMAENLNFKSENSWWYEGKQRYGKKHGRLYTWFDAVDACPIGWHLPEEKEWIELIDNLGGEKNAGLELRIDGTSGFDAYFSGFRDSAGTFFDLGHDANFWTSTDCDDKDAWRCYFDRGYNEIVQDYFNKSGGLSVRCLKD